MSKKLGKIEQIPLREVWKHEALDFTNWLAEEENLVLLSDELSINLSLIQTEYQVGSFFIDILAEIEETGKKVIIENQLERTNHDHLGKIITYASAKEAEYIIWIASDIREEHQSAIEWLNRVTNERVKFFLIRMELWSINGSAPAPKFNIISEPNNWRKIASETSSTKEVDLNKKRFQIRHSFWSKLNDSIEKKSKYFKNQKRVIPNDHWYNFRIGSAKALFVVDLLQRESQIRVSFYITHDAKSKLFDKLLIDKDDIEIKLEGYDLEWSPADTTKHAKVSTLFDFDINNEDTWSETTDLIVEKVDKFREVFIKYVK